MIAREGYSSILTLFILSLLLGWAAFLWPGGTVSRVIWILLLLLNVLMIYFFRDPERKTPEGEHLLIAPADGKVVQIRQVEETTYLNGKATQVSIFLSPLNVHVNRVPASGKLEHVSYFPGVYLMAWDERASELNEQAHFGMRHPSGVKILFRQITGFLARRIVYHIKEGDELVAGERFGIMKFGSRMDILVPSDVELSVSRGDRTVAGESVIGVIRK